MSILGTLWLPTLLSAVAVFIVSSLIHMLLRWHRNDQSRLPNEDAVAEALMALDAGDYRMPAQQSIWSGKRCGPTGQVHDRRPDLRRRHRRRLRVALAEIVRD